MTRPIGAPLCLLAGSLLVVIAAAAHPRVMGEGSSQLATIAGSAAWHEIHWTLLIGLVLSLAGLSGVGVRWARVPGGEAAWTGALVAAFAYAAWLVVVAFMAGSGAALAQHNGQAVPATVETPAVFVYDMVRPFALVAQRVGGLALGLATFLFGRALLGGRSAPRWLAWFGLVAGCSGIVLALGFAEASMADQAAFVLPVLWQVAAAVTLLVRPTPLA